MSQTKKIIVISAPSGGGKSIVAQHILENFMDFKFSISTTTRPIRNGEIEGKHYYFINKTIFVDRINKGEFIEYEEIFGNYYGTLKSEIDKVLADNKRLLFDIDVKGAYSIKKHYPNEAILVFLKPPSLQILENRLRNRKTETEEQIAKRIARAKMEIEMSSDFDYIIVNDDLTTTLEQINIIAKL